MKLYRWKVRATLWNWQLYKFGRILSLTLFILAIQPHVPTTCLCIRNALENSTSVLLTPLSNSIRDQNKTLHWLHSARIHTRIVMSSMEFKHLPTLSSVDYVGKTSRVRLFSIGNNRRKLSLLFLVFYNVNRKY